MEILKKIAKYIILIIFIIMALIGLFILIKTNVNINTPENVESQQILFFGISLENLGILLTSIGLPGTAIWSMFQFSKSKKSQQQEKSSQIAQHFSNTLLNKCDIVIRVFSLSTLSSVIDIFSQPNFFLEDFTCNELREVTEDDDFPNIYKKMKDNQDFDDIYYNLLERKITTEKDFLDKYQDKETKKIKVPKYSTKNAGTLFILDNKDLPFHFLTLVDEVLNDLESVCMNLSSKAADSNYIYPSLHQIFFDTINTLSVEISLRNNGKYSDKFYTNIIHVYTIWKKKYNKTLAKEKSKKHQNNQLLNPKIKTVF